MTLLLMPTSRFGTNIRPLEIKWLKKDFSGIYVNSLPLASGDLDNGARRVLYPLPFTAWDRLYATIDFRCHPPKKINIPPVPQPIKTARHDEKINIAPAIRVTCRMGTKNHPKLHRNPFPGEVLQIASGTSHN
jgi:hypothetical protein